MEPIQTGICILVLDPDQSSTERTVSVLASCQYKVIVAERATEALLILSESRCKIHIVLTEFDLPDMNGIEFIEKVRKMRNIPVFFLSTFVDHGVKIQCVLKGARYCYDKPLLEYQAKNLWQSCVPKRNPSTNSEIPDNRKIPKKREMRCTPEELHRKFVLAVNCLGFYAAQPERVLELMDVPGLTIEYVADQLQRYHRLFMDQKEDKGYGPLNMNSEPRNMNPSPSMGIGGNIYNELGKEVKLDSEKNHQNGIQTFSWEPNVSNHLQRYPLHMDMHSEPRNMNLSPSMGVGSTINNELGREAKLESEENRQIGLQTMNLEPNVAGTSGGGNLNRNIPENSRNFLARGRMPPANIMNAYKK